MKMSGAATAEEFCVFRNSLIRYGFTCRMWYISHE